MSSQAILPVPTAEPEVTPHKPQALSGSTSTYKEIFVPGIRALHQQRARSGVGNGQETEQRLRDDERAIHVSNAMAASGRVSSAVVSLNSGFCNARHD